VEIKDGILTWERSEKKKKEEDQVGQKKYMFEHIIERLKNIRKETVEIEKVATTVITECDEEQKTILNYLRVSIKLPYM
jgi:predicted transcriptional regulator